MTVNKIFLGNNFQKKKNPQKLNYGDTLILPHSYTYTLILKINIFYNARLAV